ncbi:MAG: sugar transferase [candidate division WOR-3 bacterium]
MKIGQILGNSKFGGGVWVVLWLAKALRQKGNEVLIFASNPTVVAKFESEGFKVYRSRYFCREISPFKDLLALFELIFYLRRLRLDVVHTHTSKAGFLGRIAARLAGVKCIIHTVHGFAFHEFSHPLIIWFYSGLERIAAWFCDRIIVINQKDYNGTLQRKIANPRKVRLVYNGIDTAAVRAIEPKSNLRQELGLKPDTILLSFTGRLCRQKNLNLLIETLPLLPNNFVLLLIGGDLNLEKELRQRVNQLGLSNRVLFLGFRSDVISLIKATDIFILPSLWEGLSISLLEAMAAGLPVIASDIKGNNEIIQDGKNGLLFNPLDRTDLARKILTLVDSENKINTFARQLAENGQRTVQLRFSQNKFLNDTLKIYEDLVKAKGLLAKMLAQRQDFPDYSIRKSSRNFGLNLRYNACIQSGVLGQVVSTKIWLGEAKRIFDLILALPLFIIVLPLCLLIGLAIKITSPGPVIFRQVRLGRGGKPFTIFKFRTMHYPCSDLRNPDGSTYNSPDDPRLTKIGKFLRMTSFDELPELWNVIRGEMSIVGPRPDLIDQLRYYSEADLQRLIVTPGITGLAQINGRNSILWQERKKLDLKYIAMFTARPRPPLWFIDLLIILKTLPVVIRQKGIFTNFYPSSSNKILASHRNDR